ncbi:hypothetical protein ACFOWE_32465 [Planomonospora corallina]|uniref:Lipoprotein n=1 Tax=Planomonospora corallina TaxID=1806052 RepID=A0ABV8IFK2_9ACTN
MGYPPQYGPPSAGETGRGLAVIVLMVTGLIIGTAVAVSMALEPPAAHGSPSSAETTSQAPDPGEPWTPEGSEESVRQAAEASFDAYAGGASGEFWDSWSTEARSAITREDYVRLFQLCPQLVPGSSFSVGEVTVAGDGALVTATRTTDQTPYDYEFVHEDGSWRYVPPPEELQEYRSKGVDRILAERRTAGACGAPLAPSTGAPLAPSSGVSPPG